MRFPYFWENCNQCWSLVSDQCIIIIGALFGMCEPNKLFIGILAIQGGFNEHKIALLKCLETNTDAFASVDLEISKIIQPCHLAKLDGLIIPGGESTTIGRFLDQEMIQKLSEWAKNESHVLFGTCAGLILLSKNLEGQTTWQTKVRRYFS